MLSPNEMMLQSGLQQRGCQCTWLSNMTLVMSWLRFDALYVCVSECVQGNDLYLLNDQLENHCFFRYAVGTNPTTQE
jgi:hypothetical protein